MENIDSIVKITDLHEVSQYLNKNTWLLLDIDDVLITPKYPHDCPNLMFRNRLEAGNFRFAKGRFYSFCNKKYLQIVKEYNKAVSTTEWQLTQKELPTLLYKWKNQSKIVMGFTSRGIEIYHETKNTLRNLGLMFGSTGINYQVRHKNITNRSGMGDEFILFCGGWPKGLTLKETYFSINGVVFIDDSLSNLKDVEKVCNELGIKFKGLHYVR